MYYGPWWFELIRIFLLGICLCWKPAHSLAQHVMIHVCSNPTSQVNELSLLVNSYGAGWLQYLLWFREAVECCDLNKQCLIMGISE